MQISSYLLLSIFAGSILSASNAIASENSPTSVTDGSSEDSEPNLAEILKPALTYDSFLAVLDDYIVRADSRLAEYQDAMRRLVIASSRLMFQPANDPKRTASYILKRVGLLLHKWHSNDFTNPIGQQVLASSGPEGYNIYFDTQYLGIIEDWKPTVKPKKVTPDMLLNSKEIREAKKAYFLEFQSMEACTLRLNLDLDNIATTLQMHTFITEKSLPTEYLQKLGALTSRHWNINEWGILAMVYWERFRTDLIELSK